MNNFVSKWIRTSLAEVAFIQMGQSPDSSSYNNRGDGLPFFQGKAEFGKLFPTTRKWCTEPKKIAGTGDILLSVRAPVGPTNLAKESCCIGRGLASIQAYKPVNQKYLLYYFRNIEPWLTQQGTGTTFAAISGSFIRDIEIPLAPLNEQKRIADKLDRVLARVDACREKCDRIPPILKRFRQSVLAAATSGQLTEDWRENCTFLNSIKVMDSENLLNIDGEDNQLNEIPQTWQWTTISQIGEVKGGKRLPKGESLVNYDTGQPYIKAGNLKNGTVTTDELQFVPFHIQNTIRRYIVAGGDVYITIVGACIGDAGIIPKSLEGANLTENAAKICRLVDCKSEFLSIWLRSPKCQKIIQNNTLSAAQGKLALFRIEKLPFPQPPIIEQNEIVRRVELLFAYADRLETYYQKARAHCDRLTPAILDKAFRGDLVPQDPNDEPASVLLERIQAERAKATATKPKRTAPQRKAKMTQLTKATVQEAIRQLPKDTFLFDELREACPGDYEALKDILFTLISDKEANLKQIFDSKTQSICFVRGNQ